MTNKIIGFFSAGALILMGVLSYLFKRSVRKIPEPEDTVTASEEYTASMAVEQYRTQAIREAEADAKVDLALSAEKSRAQQNADIQQWLEIKDQSRKG